MSEEKRKSDRKTLFVSFLDATHEDMHMLHQQMEKSGLGDEYRLFITAKPIQALDEVAVADLVKDWMGADNGMMDRDRMQKLYQLMADMSTAMKSIEKFMMNVDENFTQVEYSFSNLHKSLIGNLQHNATPNSYFAPMRVDSHATMQKIVPRIENNAPKEGEQW